MAVDSKHKALTCSYSLDPTHIDNYYQYYAKYDDDDDEKLRPQRWKTSSGIFETTKVGDVLLTLPKFSISKIISVRPDIQSIDGDQPPPMYDLTIGLETLAKWKTILNFDDKTATINHIELPMESLESLSNKKMLNNLY